MDSVLSYTLSERVLGRIYWQVYSEKLKHDHVKMQNFPLRHPSDVTRVVEVKSSTVLFFDDVLILF
jgi:hypothetical protein